LKTILGAAKYDISMLMIYVSTDKYLAPGGKIGFVLSQSLFKTAAAEARVPTFSLPDGTTFGPLIVEDMLELKPFEGATKPNSRLLCSQRAKSAFPGTLLVLVSRRRRGGQWDRFRHAL